MPPESPPTRGILSTVSADLLSYSLYISYRTRSSGEAPGCSVKYYAAHCAGEARNSAFPRYTGLTDHYLPYSVSIVNGSVILLLGVYYLLSLPIYSLILFIYHTALDRQASEVPRYLVCTEKYPAGGAAPAFLPPSSFSLDTPLSSRISDFFRVRLDFLPEKKECSRLLRTVHEHVCPGKRRGASFVLRNTRPDAGASRPPSLPVCSQIPLCTSILLFLL